ncbi:MAG: hypothetical protein GY953_16780, partial [bacterium]|nr:hypothetical protein [bacterium]
DYEQDPKSTYRLLPGGLTETTTGRPWAMHTFDAVEWDPAVRRVVVISHPEHTRFEPENRFPMFEGDWYKKLSPSHWEYDPETMRWTRLDTNAPRLFAQALTWDTDRRQLIAHNGEGTYHFDRKARRWVSVGAATEAGYHRSIVYDSNAGRVLSLGYNKSSNVIFTYDPAEPRWEQPHVQGECLPANGAAIAFDSSTGVMLYLANDHENQYHNPTGKSVTFLYHSRERRWQ